MWLLLTPSLAIMDCASQDTLFTGIPSHLSHHRVYCYDLNSVVHLKTAAVYWNRAGMFPWGDLLNHINAIKQAEKKQNCEMRFV